MSFRMMEDVVPQLIVAGVDLVTQKTLPDWNRWAIYGMTILGYVGGFMDWGGPLVKEIGKASLPLTARQISEAVGITTHRVTSSRLAFHPVGVTPGRIERSYQPEFNKTMAW